MLGNKKLLAIFFVVLASTIALIAAYFYYSNKNVEVEAKYRLYDINDRLISYNLQFEEPRRVVISGILASDGIAMDDTGSHVQVYLPESSHKKTATTLKIYFEHEAAAVLFLKDGRYEQLQTWKAFTMEELSEFLFKGDQVVINAEYPHAEYDKLIEEYYNKSEMKILNLTHIAIPSV